MTYQTKWERDLDTGMGYLFLNACLYAGLAKKKGLFGHGGDFEQSRIKCSVVVAKSSE